MLSKFTVLFKEPNFFPLIVRKQFSKFDYLSYLGGLLGLLFGISLLSLVETIYYSSLHVFVAYQAKKKTKKIHPIENLTKFLQPFAMIQKADKIIDEVGSLKKSSVHSFSIIGDTDRSVMER